MSVLIHVFGIFMYKFRKDCQTPQRECQEQRYIDLGLCFLFHQLELALQSALRFSCSKYQARSTGWQLARIEPYWRGLSAERVDDLSLRRFPRKYFKIERNILTIELLVVRDSSPLHNVVKWKEGINRRLEVITTIFRSGQDIIWHKLISTLRTKSKSSFQQSLKSILPNENQGAPCWNNLGSSFISISPSITKRKHLSVIPKADKAAVSLFPQVALAEGSIFRSWSASDILYSRISTLVFQDSEGLDRNGIDHVSDANIAMTKAFLE